VYFALKMTAKISILNFSSIAFLVMTVMFLTTNDALSIAWCMPASLFNFRVSIRFAQGNRQGYRNVQALMWKLRKHCVIVMTWQLSVMLAVDLCYNYAGCSCHYHLRALVRCQWFHTDVVITVFLTCWFTVTYCWLLHSVHSAVHCLISVMQWLPLQQIATPLPLNAVLSIAGINVDSRVGETEAGFSIAFVCFLPREAAMLARSWGS